MIITGWFFIFVTMMVPRSSYSSGRISPEKALQKLKHYCGYQERSHAEVKQKLYSLGLFKKEVEECISSLIEEGYLNEERFAVQFASGKLRIKGWGKQKICFLLRQKGISEFCIGKALKSIDEAEYLAVFDHQAGKKWDSLRLEKNNFAKKNKWRQFLIQKGFEPALFKSWSFPEKNESASTGE
jgi:regulatory protein